MTSATVEVAITVGPAPSGFVQRSGTALALNGQPYTYNGLNYWPALLDPALSTSLAAMGKGANAMRFWAFQTYLGGSAGPDFAAMDSLMAACQAAGIRVLPTLANEWGSSAPAGNPANDSGSNLDLSWWQSGYKTDVPGTWSMPYRQWVETVVTRYANDPTVLCWILTNEGQAVNSDSTCAEASALAAMQAFVADVGAMVKAADPNHLLCLGNTAGYTGSGLQYCGSKDADYGTLLESEYLDIGDYHDYNTVMPEQGGLVDALALAEAAGKAFAVNEAGIEVTGQAATTAVRASDFKAKFTAWAASGIVGGLVWNWVDANNGFEVRAGDPLLEVLGTCGIGSGE